MTRLRDSSQPWNRARDFITSLKCSLIPRIESSIPSHSGCFIKFSLPSFFYLFLLTSRIFRQIYSFRRSKCKQRQFQFWAAIRIAAREHFNDVMKSRARFHGWLDENGGFTGNFAADRWRTSIYSTIDAVHASTSRSTTWRWCLRCLELEKIHF